jgi:hypothetical protein
MVSEEFKDNVAKGVGILMFLLGFLNIVFNGVMTTVNLNKNNVVKKHITTKPASWLIWVSLLLSLFFAKVSEKGFGLFVFLCGFMIFTFFLFVVNTMFLARRKKIEESEEKAEIDKKHHVNFTFSKVGLPLALIMTIIIIISLKPIYVQAKVDALNY